jgi:hypothetical protein
MLGMYTTTAYARLRKQIFFQLVQQSGRDICFVCEKPIECAQELSVEHKIPWLQNPDDLFWDLDNIAFSHLNCNIKRNQAPHKNNYPEGMWWCHGHQQFLPVDNFSLHTEPNKDGSFRPRHKCKECRRIDQRKK